MNMDSQLVCKYRFVKQIVSDEGYLSEIEWQNKVCFQNVDESIFLKELAWVILSSGMREQIIRRIYEKLTPCFYNWQSAKLIVDNEAECYKRAIKIFKNERKISAIIESAEIIFDIGFNVLKENIESNPIETLRIFPFIGKITVYHLAKNIGVCVAKPDRHLVRIAKKEGYDDVQIFCERISEISGDSIPVVDIVFWRFANLSNDYLEVLSSVNFNK